MTSRGSKMWAKGAKQMIREPLANLDGALRQCITGQMFLWYCQEDPCLSSSKLYHPSTFQPLIIFASPQQEVLPRNQMKGIRKSGVKLELSKLRAVCGDQLAPFEGLWSYTQDVDYYPGTIFRFPLRNSPSSALRTSKRDLNSGEVRRLMDTYFHEARISLLFLRRIKSIDFSEMNLVPDVLLL